MESYEAIIGKYHLWNVFVGFIYLQSSCCALMETSFMSSWEV